MLFKTLSILAFGVMGLAPLSAQAASGCSMASHYGVGDGYHGRTTANGERYNAYGHSTAHRYLPFGTRLRVTNQSNGKSVIAFSQIDESLEDVRRAELLKERPWLSYYDKGVPYTIAIPNVPAGHLLRSAARRFPAQPAPISEGRRLSYQQLDGEANRFAHFLLSMDVKKGDRVMLVLPNLPQLVIAYFGTLKAGAVPVFTLPTNQPEELIRQIRNSGSSALVTLTQFDTLIHQIKTRLEPGGGSPLRHVIFAHIADWAPV